MILNIAKAIPEAVAGVVKKRSDMKAQRQKWDAQKIYVTFRLHGEEMTFERTVPGYENQRLTPQICRSVSASITSEGMFA